MKKRILPITLVLSLLLALTQVFAFAASDDTIDFPDPNFEAAVRYWLETPTGAITKSDAKAVTDLYLGYRNITDLTGIEYFTELRELNIRNNQVSKLDLSKNTKLEVLYASDNQLFELDLSKNAMLMTLECDNNSLTELDVSNNTALIRLVSWGNRLTGIDLSKNTALTGLHFSERLLTELDVSNNTALEVMSVMFTRLTGLDLTKNTALKTLIIHSNRLKELDLTNNAALKELVVYDNRLTELDLSNNKALEILYCYNNQLTELDVGNNTALEYIGVGNNRLTQLDVSNNTALIQLSCDGNQLTEMVVCKNTALEFFQLCNNRISELDLSNNYALTTLHIRNNLIAKLDVSSITDLHELYADNNFFPDESAIAGLDESSLVSFEFDPQKAPGSASPYLNTAAEWAREEIAGAINKGFVPDDIQNNYRVVITRQEFCRMAVRLVEHALQKDIDDILAERGLFREFEFSDTSDMTIAAAAALGITNGTRAPTESQPGVFSPNGEFTRQEAATMLMRVCTVLGIEVDTSIGSGFADMDAAADWAHDAINFVRANGIMRGISEAPPMFRPSGFFTRQESIVTLFRIVVFS